MDLEDFSRIMGGATKSTFRLETLPQYLVPQEEEGFTAWREGRPWPARTPENSASLARLKGIVASGIRRYRVHILDYPLSEYSRFELRGYLENQVAGEEIHIADRAEYSELEDMHEDFWLIDDEVAVCMVYDDEGHFLQPEPIDDVKPYLAIRDTALRCAEPLDEFIARRKPQLTI
jgi:uncharacterized protein DUF6879